VNVDDAGAGRDQGACLHFSVCPNDTNAVPTQHNPQQHTLGGSVETAWHTLITPEGDSGVAVLEVVVVWLW